MSANSDTPKMGHRALIDHSLCERYIKELEGELAKLKVHAEAMAITLDTWARIDECQCSSLDAYRRDYPEGA